MQEKNKLVAYCGLYCGDCLFYKGEIADLARDLRKKLREAKFDRVSRGMAKFFREFEDYERCYRVLGALVKLRCRRACRNGGGPPFCKMRKCCDAKKIDGCWECSQFEDCKKLDFLKPVHGDGHLQNLRAIRKKGLDGFVKGEKHW